jgi:hypothetical protein
MERLIEVPNSSMTLLGILMLMFTYFFPCKNGTNVCAEIFENKKLPTLMECPNSSFPKDW